MVESKPKRPEYKFQKKPARTKGNRDKADDGNAVYAGAAFTTGHRGGSVRLLFSARALHENSRQQSKASRVTQTASTDMFEEVLDCVIAALHQGALSSGQSKHIFHLGSTENIKHRKVKT